MTFPPQGPPTCGPDRDGSNCTSVPTSWPTLLCCNLQNVILSNVDRRLSYILQQALPYFAGGGEQVPKAFDRRVHATCNLSRRSYSSNPKPQGYLKSTAHNTIAFSWSLRERLVKRHESENEPACDPAQLFCLPLMPIPQPMPLAPDTLRHIKPTLADSLNPSAYS